VLISRAGRWVIGLMTGVAMSLSASEPDDSWGPGGDGPTKLSEKFINLVLAVQAETSIDRLNLWKNMFRDSAGTIASLLDSRKYEVTRIRADIKDVDAAIQAAQLKRAESSDAEQANNTLANLKAQRALLVVKEAERYKEYARYRGRAIALGMICLAIIDEADKRIAQLGNNTARGNWAGAYTSEDGKSDPQGGPFSLLIDPQTGAVSGGYSDGGGEVGVSGKWDASTGACSGRGNDPEAPAAFSGTLLRGAAGYTGTGTFSYKYKAGGSGSGTWTAK
jgi:hypothetical protein